jgi:hypothetical protein
MKSVGKFESIRKIRELREILRIEKNGRRKMFQDKDELLK